MDPLSLRERQRLDDDGYLALEGLVQPGHVRAMLSHRSEQGTRVGHRRADLMPAVGKQRNKAFPQHNGILRDHDAQGQLAVLAMRLRGAFRRRLPSSLVPRSSVQAAPRPFGAFMRASGARQ